MTILGLVIKSVTLSAFNPLLLLLPRSLESLPQRLRSLWRLIAESRPSSCTSCPASWHVAAPAGRVVGPLGLLQGVRLLFLQSVKAGRHEFVHCTLAALVQHSNALSCQNIASCIADTMSNCPSVIGMVFLKCSRNWVGWTSASS
jgi:hypothetical protein